MIWLIAADNTVDFTEDLKKPSWVMETSDNITIKYYSYTKISYILNLP